MVFTERQNSFALRGESGTLGGRPDLIARLQDSGTIIGVKTRKARELLTSPDTAPVMRTWRPRVTRGSCRSNQRARPDRVLAEERTIRPRRKASGRPRTAGCGRWRFRRCTQVSIRSCHSFLARARP